MIEATQRKLREAQFFYGRLVDSKDLMGPDRNEPDAFSFYLSAFMSAARSVPWVLQCEEKEKYEAWKPKWEEQLSPFANNLVAAGGAVADSAFLLPLSRADRVVSFRL